MITVWSIHDTTVPWMDQLQSLIYIYIFFFSNSCWWVRFTKSGCLVENRARYLKQYLFCFYAQHILLFLSIILNWSIEDNFTYTPGKKACWNSPRGNVRQKETMGRIIAKRELIGTCNRVIYSTSPLLMSHIQLDPTKHSCVLNVSWKKPDSLHVTRDCRALIEIRFILSELYFIGLSDTKNFLVNKVNMLLSKGKKGTYNGRYGERIDQHPLFQSLTTVVTYDRRLHTFSTMKFIILAI